MTPPTRDELEARLHYPLGDQLPGPGCAIDVAPGIRWLRMGLPFELNHINLWLVRDEVEGRQGWTIVDCGISNDDTRERWKNVFASALDGLPVLRVLVTHMHPDHIGLCQWLCDHWSAPLYISATDYNLARINSQSTLGFGGEPAARFFATHGLTDDQAQAQVRNRKSYYPAMVPSVPDTYVRLLDGMTLQLGQNEWTCIAGYGHAPEHMALYCPATGVLISGDMVLPRISTNVSVFHMEPLSDPLSLFLSSLKRYEALPEDTLVLPSHGKPFKGLHERLQQLNDHHQERLDELTEACRHSPHHAADALDILFKRDLDLHQTTFAMGESLAHLHRLWYSGLVDRVQGEDGVYRFSAVA
ncbi:MBL fold metallo-hydrolase [Hydrogenophaga sp. 5NK40-0174]|uniref:MBL fold metallo-hydrolase n=1 Tax=Hydrogenophaga sp. 5NK40-0174 TaxID=3127649 RepID=UPI00310ABBDC